MTATTTSPVTSAVAPAGRRPRPRGRLLLLVAATALVLTITVLLLLGSRTSGQPLDPDNPAPDGAQAMARVLASQGVDVRRIDGRDALADKAIGTGSSVVITNGRLMTDSMWSELLDRTRGADRLILVAPGERALDALDAPFDLRSASFPGTISAECDAPLARGLSISGGTERYAPHSDSTATVCFPPDGGFGSGGDRGGYVAILPKTADRPETVLLGTEHAVRNNDVREDGNAALGLRSLGQSPQLYWWSVRPGQVDQSDAPPPVWPRWLGPVTFTLLLTVAVLMIVRGRRLGRLAVEPLPVIVKASETTRSRGQLYRKAGDTVRASTILRSASRGRLARFLGVPPAAAEAALVEAVASSTGRDPYAVHDLLYGAPAPNEATLTRIAQELSSLEKEVRRT